MVKFDDVFKLPLTNVDWDFWKYLIIAVTTTIPGTLLWLVTFGAFRYFHLIHILCQKSITNSIKNGF